MDKRGKNPLNVKDEEEFLGNLTGWSLNRDGVHKLEKTVKAETFSDALNLLHDIANLAGEENHHPDMLLSFNKLTLSLSTHKAGGLTEKDFVLAARIDEILEKKGLLI